jgi:hypothetical protein
MEQRTHILMSFGIQDQIIIVQVGIDPGFLSILEFDTITERK